MKRFVTLLLVTMFLTLLAACGEKEDTTTEDPSPTNTAAATATTAVAPTETPSPTLTPAPVLEEKSYYSCEEMATYQIPNAKWKEEMENNSDLMYTAEEWMSTGKLVLPFDPEVYEAGADDLYARNLIPEEALEQATTMDLAIVMRDQQYMTILGYESTAHFLFTLRNTLNGTDELLGREDMAQCMLELYREDSQLLLADYEEGVDDLAFCVLREKVALEEIFLADNRAYAQLSDAEKTEVLSIAKEVHATRLDNIDNEVYTTEMLRYKDVPSPFYLYIYEQDHEDGVSAWMGYLTEIDYDIEGSFPSILDSGYNVYEMGLGVFNNSEAE